MVNILTGTPFDEEPRLNHRADEVSLEFPSSAGSSARGLMALKACNWRARSRMVDQIVRVYNDLNGIFEDGEPIGKLVGGTRIKFKRVKFGDEYYLGIDKQESTPLPWLFEANDKYMSAVTEFFGMDIEIYGRVHQCTSAEEGEIPGFYYSAGFASEKMMDEFGIPILSINIAYGPDPADLLYMNETFFGFDVDFSRE